MMEHMQRVIFVDKDGASRAPMAAQIFGRLADGRGIEALSRGLVVPFPAPMNQKCEAVLISQGIDCSGFLAQQLEPEDIIPGTFIFTMEAKQRLQVIEKIPAADEDNTFALSAYVGDELDIMDPYGGAIQVYGMCYEVLCRSIEKMIARIWG